MGLNIRPRVLALVLALSEPPLRTVTSISNQLHADVTIMVVAGSVQATSGLPDKVRKLVVPSNMKLCVGRRVVRSLNAALGLVSLADYDYLLKADDDVVFPQLFLSINTQSDYDLMGRGCGLLIRVKPFLEVAGGKFKEACVDDVYMNTLFELAGKRVLHWKWVFGAEVMHEPSYSRSRFFELGRDYRRMGYLVFPFSRGVLKQMIERSPSYLYLLMGYFAGSILMEPRYDIAEKVAREDLYALLRGVKARFGQVRHLISMVAGVFTIALH